MTEHDKICEAYWLWRNYSIFRFPCLLELRHIPNEGKRNPGLAKAIGIRAGVLDYQMLVPSRYCHGFLLEIKVPGTKPSRIQRDEIRKLQEWGYWAQWTDNLDLAIFLTEEYCRDVIYPNKEQK